MAKKKPTPSVILIAVSSEKQQDGHSLDVQLERCKSAVKQNGDKLIEVIKSDEKSRSIMSLERAVEAIPEVYGKLVSMIVDGRVKRLYFYRLNRLGRMSGLLHQIRDYCLEMGVSLFEVESGDLIESKKSGDSSLMWAIKAWQAENQVSVLTANHEPGMIDRAQKGKFPRIPPYGYSGDYDDGYPTVESEKRAIQMVFELYLSSMGGKRIAERLDAEKVRTRGGKYPSETFVASIIDRRWTYAGYTEINRNNRATSRPYGRFNENSVHEAFISEETAKLVDLEVALRSQAKRLSESKHYLSGCVWCRSCGQRMRVHWNNHETKKGNLKPSTRCVRCKTSHTLRDANGILVKFFQSEINRLAHQIKEGESQSAINPLDALKSKLSDNQKAFDRLYELQLSGRISDENFERQLSRLGGANAEIMQKIEEANSKVEMSPEKKIGVLESLTKTLEEEDPSLNAILRQTIRVWVEEDRTFTLEEI